MRTTLTLESDVAILLERLQQVRGSSLKEAANEALRRGAEELLKPKPKERKTYTHPVNTGVPRIPLDDISEALAFAEGEDYK
jgi:hypothetical protein